MHSYKKCILTIILVAVQASCHHKVLAEGEPCSNAVNRAAGTCVNALQCVPYKALLLTHGAGASDLLRDALCYYTRDYPIVCCPTMSAPALQTTVAPARHWAYAAAPAVQSAAAPAQHWAYTAAPAVQSAAAPAQQLAYPSAPAVQSAAAPAQHWAYTAAPVVQSAVAPAQHWAYTAAPAVQSAVAVSSAQQLASAAPISAPAAPQSASAVAFNARKPSMYGPLYAPHCGYSRAIHLRSPAPSEGYPADLHAYPWLAALGYQSRSGKPIEWTCGGSLISARHVLTSAQCVYGRSDLKVVRFGDHDLNDDEDGAYPIDVSIERVTVHPNFKSGGDGNALADIAIIRLQRDIKFSGDIHPICLPLPDNVRYKNYTGYHPFLAGWGSLQAEGIAQHSMLEFWYPVISPDECRKAMTKGFKIQEIDEQVLCTGYIHGESNVCLTDKGAPLMYPTKGAYFHAIGVLSSSIGCERNRYPRVYTRVSQYLDFILDNLY